MTCILKRPFHKKIYIIKTIIIIIIIITLNPIDLQCLTEFLISEFWKWKYSIFS